MTRATPPRPNNASPQALYDWAMQIAEFTEDRSRREAEVIPQPIFLQHQRPTTLERASDEGVMMWNASIKSPVVASEGAWHAVAGAEWVASNFNVAQYAEMRSPALIASLGAAWTNVVNYATPGVTPRGIAPNYVNGSMAFAYPGVYAVTISLAIVGHNSSNSGRTTNVRMYNTTDGTPLGGSGIPIGIGRNVEDTNFAVSFLTEIGEGEVGKEVILQLGNGDSITSIDTLGMVYSVHCVSEWRNPLYGMGGDGSSSAISWGSIQGDINSQADLIAAIAAAGGGGGGLPAGGALGQIIVNTGPATGAWGDLTLDGGGA